VAGTVGTEVDAEPEVEVEVETISLADEPSPSQQVPQIDAEPAAGRDRYLKDLDQAVNDDDEDEAMTAFFEGSGDSRNRRFGWRR
jgi:hypothetical protein